MRWSAPFIRRQSALRECIRVQVVRPQPRIPVRARSQQRRLGGPLARDGHGQGAEERPLFFPWWSPNLFAPYGWCAIWRRGESRQTLWLSTARFCSGLFAQSGIARVCRVTGQQIPSWRSAPPRTQPLCSLPAIALCPIIWYHAPVRQPDRITEAAGPQPARLAHVQRLTRLAAAS